MTVNKESKKTGTDTKPPRKTGAKTKSEPVIPETTGAAETGEITETVEVQENIETKENVDTKETSQFEVENETTAGKNDGEKTGEEKTVETIMENIDSQLAVEFTLEIKKEEIEKKFDETLDKYAADIKMPGFRAGKAPIELVRSRFKDAIQEEIINEMLNEAVLKKINTEKLRVLTKPVVKKLDYQEGQDLKADMVMEVIPDINLPDLDTMEIEVPTKELEHEAFDEQKAIDRLLSAQMRQAPVTDRGIKENDMVTLKYQSKILATKKIDRTKSEYYMVIKNNNTFEIIDLYDDILDKKIHEQMTLKRTYPADYKKKAWAGKEIEHYINIDAIYEMVKPELDEKFFKTQGVNNEDELKQRLQQEHDEHAQMHREDKKTGFIIDKLNEMINIPVPRALVEEEMTRMYRENPYQFAFNYKDEIKKNNVLEVLRNRAEKSVRFSFILDAIKEKYNLKVTSEDLENQYKSIADRNHWEYKEVRNFYMKPENKSYLEDNLLKVKIFDLLKEKIKVKEV
ncbi:MAG: trigger factor [Acidobacteria bacterium]|jgi:trigger factor|nr:trigger factor [Acidobacteriota bacterium]